MVNLGFPSVQGGVLGGLFWDSHLSREVSGEVFLWDSHLSGEVSGEVFFGIPICLGRCLGGFGRSFGGVGAWKSHDIVTSCK